MTFQGSEVTRKKNLDHVEKLSIRHVPHSIRKSFSVGRTGKARKATRRRRMQRPRCNCQHRSPQGLSELPSSLGMRRHCRQPLLHVAPRQSKERLQKPGDVRTNRIGKGIDGKRVPKRIPAPYAKTLPHILKKYRSKQSSLVTHLRPAHFGSDQQDGSFSHNSPMQFTLH